MFDHDYNLHLLKIKETLYVSMTAITIHANIHACLARTAVWLRW